jgi:uncharacterized protein
MNRILRSNILDITGFSMIGLALLLLSFSSGFKLPLAFPPSLLNLNTIFLSILIEALPFVLIGVLIAGFIQIFVTEDQIQRWIPKNKFLAVIMSCIVGALFPACECGIVPIVRRLVAKGVPIHAAMLYVDRSSNQPSRYCFYIHGIWKRHQNCWIANGFRFSSFSHGSFFCQQGF